MTTPYDEMWEKLNLDLTAHEGLLQVLGKFYGDIYLTRESRRKGMEYLDFVLSEVHGLRIKEIQAAKAQGRKVIGTFWELWPGVNFPTPALALKLVKLFQKQGKDVGREGKDCLSRHPCGGGPGAGHLSLASG